MKIKSKIFGSKESILTIENIDSYNQNSHFECQNIIVEEEEDVKINCVNLITDGLTLIDLQMCFSTPQTIKFEIEGESVIMNFTCCNNVEMNIDDMGGDKYAVENTHNILYASGFDNTFEIPALERINYFSLVLSLDFYSKLIHNDWEIHPQFSKNIFNKTSCYLNPAYVPFTPDIQWIIREIKNCRHNGVMERMYIEAKIKELLILQLETLNQSTELKDVIDQEEYSKLLEAKLILENNFTNAPTLQELSRKISLNEFKLKKGFKACFETTVKSYVTKLRMEHAKRLFKNETANVGEVAYKCGYKDVSHFSAAFKLFYGFTPTSFRNMGMNIKFQFLYWGLEDIVPFYLF